jgi:hypothetical protein
MGHNFLPCTQQYIYIYIYIYINTHTHTHTGKTNEHLPQLSASGPKSELKVTLVNLCIDERIILKCVVSVYGVKLWSEFT